MARDEIVEGLRRAVSKGEPIEKAIASFSNAGYSQEDIEDAARVLNMPTIYQQQNQVIYQPQSQIYQPQTQQAQTQQTQKLPADLLPPGVIQRVSGYDSRQKNPGSSAITIILFVLLLVLLGILAAVIIFKDELSSFFSSIFGVLL